MRKASHMVGKLMKTIEIEDDLYKYILNNIEAFGETPSQILRRLLVLPEEEVSIEPLTHIENIEVVTAPEPITVATLDYDIENDKLNQSHLHQGLLKLFGDELFISEPVFTNKFMMMLTAMYFENTDAFIDAAETTKGRTRAYLGMHLEALLNAENEEEQLQFKASKPRMIPETPYWVITNANTGRKRIILTQMMVSMGYPLHLIERIKEEILP